MVEIRNHDDLKAWLDSRPEDVRADDARLIASRAALRVLPAFWQAKTYREDFEMALLVPSFRAMAVASFAGTWPKLATGDWQEAATFAATFATA